MSPISVLNREKTAGLEAINSGKVINQCVFPMAREVAAKEAAGARDGARDGGQQAAAAGRAVGAVR